MKKYKLFLGLIIIIMIAGCDLLNQKPQNDVTPEQAFINARSAKIAMNGVYSAVQDYYGGGLYSELSMLKSDIIQTIGTLQYRAYDTYNGEPTIYVGGAWGSIYSAINRANNVIEEVHKLSDISQKEENKILGQAYFIRGLAYFDLTKAWGGVPDRYGTMGVPIVTKPSKGVTEKDFVSRSSLEDSYAQIKSDLNQAETKLKDAGYFSRNKATEAAVNALLSRLYLYLGNFKKAADYATKVINNQNFALVSYHTLFTEKDSKSIIFSLSFNSSDSHNYYFDFFPAHLGGRGEFALHKPFALMLLSNTADQRGEFISYSKAKDAYYPTKFHHADGSDNIPVLRLAEMYLNRAEARAQLAKKDPSMLSESLSDLNTIRNRAGLQDTTGSGVDNPEKVLYAIYHCEFIEFYEEFHRYYDLARTGRALKVLKDVPRLQGPPVSLTDPGRQVFPIPKHEMDANPNMKQNKAWQ
jgi:tetratricopeptide (TPR) repeat protein